MSNVLSFKRRGAFLLLYSSALFRDSGGFPAPFWIEEWHSEGFSKVIWRSATYQAMRRDALDIMRRGDQLIDFVAHPGLMDDADAALLAASTVGMFR